MFLATSLPEDQMEALAEYFKVFSEPSRLAVLEALRGGPLNVTAVVEASGLSQALVSKHLKLLTIAGVVQRRPEGSLVFYEVIDKAVLKLLGQAEMLLLATRRHQLSWELEQQRGSRHHRRLPTAWRRSRASHPPGPAGW